MPSIGERLRQAREAIPASLAEASRATRIRVDFLESMERDSFSFISGRVYVVGMLRSYARWLRIDDAGIAAEYDRIYGPPEAPTLAESLASRQERTMPIAKPRKPPWAMVGAAAVAILVVLLLFSLIGGGGNVATPPPVPTPTPVATATASPTSTAVAAQGAQLVVAVTGTSSWVHVVAGDTTPQLLEFQGFLNRGVTRTFTAPDLLKVQFGNLGAVRVNVNGTDVGVPGPTGQAGAFIVSAGSNALTPDPSSTVPPPSQQTTVTTGPRPPAPPPSPSPSTTPSPTPAASPSPSPPPPQASPTPTATVAPRESTSPTPTATVVSPTAH